MIIIIRSFAVGTKYQCCWYHVLTWNMKHETKWHVSILIKLLLEIVEFILFFILFTLVDPNG